MRIMNILRDAAEQAEVEDLPVPSERQLRMICALALRLPEERRGLFLPDPLRREVLTRRGASQLIEQLMAELAR